MERRNASSGLLSSLTDDWGMTWVAAYFFTRSSPSVELGNPVNVKV
jgi:hypothetical protein